MSAPALDAPAGRARSRSVAPGLLVALAVALMAALAVGVRALGLEYVFVGGEIVFPPADPQYHLRRALYTLVRFPDVLLFDPYINHPGGAPVPWPPLFDFVLGAAGRLTGGGVRDLEQAAAWSGPVCAALACVAVHLVGVRMGSRRIGVVAALLYAGLPISVVYSRVGNADHHAAVAMIGAWLLLSVVSLADPDAPWRRIAWLGLGLAAVRVAMLLTWHGSLLYLLPAEGLLVATAASTARRALPAAQAAGAIAAAALVAGVLAVSPSPLGGPYSSIALSRLHVAALLGVATTTGGLLAALHLGRGRTPGARLAWAAGAAALFAVLLFALPGPREGIVPAVRFLTLGDEVGAITGEQTPLFVFGDRLHGPPAVHSWGALAYLLPLAPLAALTPWPLARRRGGRAGRAAEDAPAEQCTTRSAGIPSPPAIAAARLVLAGWGLFFCTLAVVQRRYGNDAAPAAAVLLATGAVALADRALRRIRPDRRRRWLAAVAAGVAVVCALMPAILAVYVPRARGTVAALAADGPPPPRVERSIAHTLHRFAGRVRAVTPPTSGYLAPGAAPEYGVIAHANLGHALQYRARRATATDPFWWYIGRENWERSFAFLAAAHEEEALALARQLAARYVVTMPGLGEATVVGRLHAGDGAGDPGRSGLGRFRLVLEARPGGLPIGALFGRVGPRTTPYKLFEIVTGAVLAVDAPAGTPVEAAVTVETPDGRRFVWRTSARAGADGIARLRVPYSTGGSTGEAADAPPGEAAEPVARTRGPYRVRAEDGARRVDVAEEDVRRGRVVRMGRGPTAPTRS